MREHSKAIEWCTHTENPFAGCYHECAYCYARRFANRLCGIEKTMQAALRRGGMAAFTPVVSPYLFERLDGELARARKPRRIFVGSMGDIGGRTAYYVATWKDGRFWIEDRVLPARWVRESLISLAFEHPRHTFLVLTKRPENLRDDIWAGNMHVGVSVATSGLAHRTRIDKLRDIDTAGVRWVSVEPLLDRQFDSEVLRGAEWVVVGAQSGPGAPPTIEFVESARRIVHWCRVLGVPCFVKENMRRAAPSLDWPKEIPEVKT
jgi:protein gp37